MTKTVQLFRIINANASTLHYPLSVWNVWCVTVMVTVAGSLSISVSVPECARCNVRGELIRCHSAMITFIYEIKIAKNRVIHAHTHRLQRRPATARAADTDTDADTATDTGADTHIAKARESEREAGE